MARHLNGLPKDSDGQSLITLKGEGSHSTSANGSNIPCQALGSPPRGYVVSSRAALWEMIPEQNGGSYGSVDGQSVSLSGKGRGSFYQGIPVISPSHSQTNRRNGLII